MNLKYDIYDQIALAIRETRPFLVVESYDDRQIYTQIAQYIHKKIDVFQVSEFDNYTSGCESVIKLIDKIQSDFQQNNIAKYVLGIIDRDTRPYIAPQARPYNTDTDWAKLQTLQGLFILKYYAIETYFATPKSIEKLLPKITYATTNDISVDVISHLLSKHQEHSELLFYIALDALKEHYLGNDIYKAKKSFAEDEHGSAVTANDFLQHFANYLTLIQSDLDEFASQKSITLQNTKQVIKGKWYLYYFSKKVYEQLSGLESQNLHFIPNKEVFKMKLQGNNSQRIRQIYDRTLECIDEDELEDVIQELRKLI